MGSINVKLPKVGSNAKSDDVLEIFSTYLEMKINVR
jgi:hypothetical protein